MSSSKARREGVHWAYLRPHEHLFYFSLSTLTEVLHKAGFEVLYRGTLNRPAMMKWVDMTGSSELRGIVVGNLGRLAFLRKLYRRARSLAGYDDLLVVFARRAEANNCTVV